MKRRGFLKLTASPIIASFLSSSLFAGISASTKREALVIGNGKYLYEPLPNPVNDASAIAELLGGMGFKVQLGINTSFNDLDSMISTYIQRVKDNQSIGLFYYAGHGVQLAWENYLVPVDADILSIDDIPKKTYSLNKLLKLISSAKNPMNVIILDACRDNPFGKKIPIEQKGLSQFDAPVGCLLAYATAPGNVASDGTGKHGLYTEYLLREMQKPNAPIEDVMKRVRLNVRLKSNGQQIPWESTSLEDNFSFNRGAVAIKSSEDIDADAELKLWKQVETSTDPKIAESYLFAYPNGIYSQLAQAKLDLLLNKIEKNRVKPISSYQNPFSKGSASGLGKYRSGQFYTFATRDAFSGVQVKEQTFTVTSIELDRIIFNHGELVTDILGNPFPSTNNQYITQPQTYPAEYAIGNRWMSQFRWRSRLFPETEVKINYVVTDRQRIKSKAGDFYAFVVEVNGQAMGSYPAGGMASELLSPGARIAQKIYIDPDKCPLPIIVETLALSRYNKVDDSSIVELVATNYKA